MPIYVYVCKQCNKTEERRRSVADRDKSYDCVCADTADIEPKPQMERAIGDEDNPAMHMAWNFQMNN